MNGVKYWASSAIQCVSHCSERFVLRTSSTPVVFHLCHIMCSSHRVEKAPHVGTLIKETPFRLCLPCHAPDRLAIRARTRQHQFARIRNYLGGLVVTADSPGRSVGPSRCRCQTSSHGRGDSRRGSAFRRDCCICFGCVRAHHGERGGIAT